MKLPPPELIDLFPFNFSFVEEYQPITKDPSTTLNHWYLITVAPNLLCLGELLHGDVIVNA